MACFSALYISIDTPHIVLFCPGSRYFAFSTDIFIGEVHSVEPPENRSPGLQGPSLAEGGFLPVCGLHCSPSPPTSAGPFLPRNAPP